MNGTSIYIIMKTFCSQRKHPSKVRAFSAFVATRKGTPEPLEALSKQPKISDVMAVGANRSVLQAKG